MLSNLLSSMLVCFYNRSLLSSKEKLAHHQMVLYTNKSANSIRGKYTSIKSVMSKTHNNQFFSQRNTGYFMMKLKMYHSVMCESTGERTAAVTELNTTNCHCSTLIYYILSCFITQQANGTLGLNTIYGFVFFVRSTFLTSGRYKLFIIKF